ncbi:MAG: hypothetical protein HY270_12280 [Deltaproteobacteria bacterium]|nr:hypothetical protein [Deltaproteobacteria bacterium]
MTSVGWSLGSRKKCTWRSRWNASKLRDRFPIVPLLLIAAGRANGQPVPCSEPTTTQTKWVDCRRNGDVGNGSQQNKWGSLNIAALQVQAGDLVLVEGGPCPADGVMLTGSNIHLQAQGQVKVTKRGNASSAFVINSPAQNVEIENFGIEPDNGLFANHGIWIQDTGGSGVQNVLIKDVAVSAASIDAGIRITSPGDRVCIVNAIVTGAGGPGIDVKVESVSNKRLSNLQFIGGTAAGNASDGYSIEHNFNLTPITGVVDAYFYGAHAESNRGDGFDVSGGKRFFSTSRPSSMVPTRQHRALARRHHPLVARPTLQPRSKAEGL